MSACQRLLEFAATWREGSIAWSKPSPREEGWTTWRVSARWRDGDRSWREVFADGRTPEEAAGLAILEIEKE